MRTADCRAVSVAISSIAAAASAALGQPDPVLVVASRSQAPGLPAGAILGDFKTPSIGPDGRVAFTARVSGGGSQAEWGVWVGGPAGIEALVTDDPAWPGTPAGFEWTDFTTNPGAPVIAPDGSVNISAFYHKDGGADFRPALLAGTPGDFHPVLTLDDHPPGAAPGVTFAELGDLSPGDPQYRSAGGFMAVRGVLAGPGVEPSNNTGVWMRPPGGAFELAVREGDPLPGGSAAPPLTGNMTLAPDGELAFLDWNGGAPAVWLLRDGAITRAFAAGDPAPGLPAGVTIDTVGHYGLGPGGALAIAASIAGPGVTSADDGALWIGSTDASGRLQLVVRKGDPAPGQGSEWTFSGFRDVHAHRPDSASFWGILHSSAGAAERRGIWRYEDGALRLLMELQMPAPGLFGDAKIISLRSAASNVWGQMLLEVVLGGDGMPSTRALYAVNRDGSLIPLVREGNEIEHEPGQFGTIRQIAIATHTGSGLFPDLAINARGEIVFHVDLELIDAIYTMRIGCRADVDDSGALDVFDFLAFQDLFTRRDARADFTGEGAIDFFDFLAFQEEFASGCR